MTYHTYAAIQKGLSARSIFVAHTLPISRRWLDMIACGEKKEEYREDKPYWQTRILDMQKDKGPQETFILRAGYSKDSPAILIDAEPVRRVGGDRYWGARPDERYIVLKINKVWTISPEGKVQVLCSFYRGDND